MFDKIREDIINFITNRITLLTFLFIILGGILIYRCFDLQIVQGQEYLDKFVLQAEKTRDIASSRGSIYDCNGVSLVTNTTGYCIRFTRALMPKEEQNDIIERLNLIDEENKVISENLALNMAANSEKLAKLNNFSNELKNSAIEG